MLTNEPPLPGLYENVPFETYLSWPYISNSTLKHAKKSLQHYRHALAAGSTETTDAMRFGTLVHAGRLEPLAIIQRFIVRPRFEDQIRRPNGETYENPRASKAYKEKVAEWQATIGDKMEVDASDYEQMVNAIAALSRSERACQYLNGPGSIEVSFVWDDPITGLRCKGRCDKLSLSDKRITDLKTAYDPWDFERTIGRLGYHRQGAFYIDGIRELKNTDCQFCLVAVEPEPPHGVRAAPLAEEAIRAGRREYSSCLARIAAAQESGEWEEASDPDEWHVPTWATPEEQPVELNLGGRTVTV